MAQEAAVARPSALFFILICIPQLRAYLQIAAGLQEFLSHIARCDFLGRLAEEALRPVLVAAQRCRWRLTVSEGGSSSRPRFRTPPTQRSLCNHGVAANVRGVSVFIASRVRPIEWNHDQWRIATRNSGWQGRYPARSAFGAGRTVTERVLEFSF